MSGSSGGGSSGEVSWPQWISTLHKDGADIMFAAVAGALNPFIGATSFDPATEISLMMTELSDLDTAIAAFDPASDWSDMIDLVQNKYAATFIDETSIAAAVAAYSAILDDDLTNKTLPRFRGGMRDINAVQSTAFVIGQSLLEAWKAREVAKYAADYRGDLEKARAEIVINTAGKLLEPQLAKLDAVKAAAQLNIDTQRIRIVALKEQRDSQMELDEMEQKWGAEKWTAYGNYIASMSGGTSRSTGRTPSTTQSAIGGALSGAAAGGSMGGWWGAAAGGILGAGSAMLNR